MDIASRVGFEERAEIYRNVLRRQIRAWQEAGAFPGRGPEDPLDIVAILVSPSAKRVLAEAEAKNGQTMWEQLQSMDIPAPIVEFTSVEEEFWSPLYRQDLEALNETVPGSATLAPEEFQVSMN